MTHLAVCFAFLAGPLLPASSDVQSPIQALSDPATLMRGVGVQAGSGPGEFLINGSDYSAEVGPAGLEFTPILGTRSSRTHSLSLSLAGMRRGATDLSAGVLPSGVEADGLQLSRQLGQGLEERFEASEEGVELSYLFPTRPPGQGDLVVRLALSTSLGEPEESPSGGLAFLLPDIGGVRIGAVTGIDAAGHQVTGELRYQAGVLELSLPGDFVDQASYPLLLDPLLGSAFPVSSDPIFGSLEDTRPDLAYDVTTDQYLIAWERSISATDNRIYARRFSGSGTPVGGTFMLSQATTPQGVCRNPAVANVNRADSFVVVWERSAPLVTGITTTQIQMQVLKADFTTVGAPQVVVGNLSSGTERFNSPDVCGEGVVADSGALADFVVVWDDDLVGQLSFRHYGFDQSGVLDSSDPIGTLATDSIFSSYGEPSIARASGAFNRSVVVATAFNTLAADSIRGWVMNLDGSVQGNGFLVASNLSLDAGKPDIDGYDRQWVCAWEQDDSNGTEGISATTISLQNPAGTASVAPATILALPTGFDAFHRPAVGFSFGKSWIAWRKTYIIFPSIEMRGYDSATCTSCEGPFTLVNSNSLGAAWAAVATPTSGGAYSVDKGCVAFSFTDSGGSDDLSAQLVSNNAQLGGYQNLGGGCGSVGTVSFTGPPAIGTSWWYSILSGLPPTTLATFYNLSTASSTLAIPCGACLWLPFETSGSGTVKSGPSGLTSSSQALTIPCKPNLVGTQMILQWTLFNPPVSPCAAYPNLSVSDLWRVTFGQ